MAGTSSVAEKVKHLHTELEKVTADRESLERQLARFKRRVTELSEQNETIGGQLVTSKGTQGSLRTGQNHLSTKLVELESELSLARREHSSLKSALTNTQTELDILKQENDSLRGRLFESESGREKSSSVNEQLETALNETQDRFIITSRLKDTASSKLKETKKERDVFRVEIDRLTRQLRNRTLRILIIVLAATTIACFAIWTSYTLSNSALVEKLNKTSVTITSLEKKASEQLAKISEHEATITVKDADIQELETAALKLQSEIEGLNGTLLALTKQRDDRIMELGDNVKFNNTRSEENLAALRRNKDIEIEELNEKIVNLKSQITSLMRTRAIAIPALIAALDHPSMSVQNVAVRSLEKLTNKKFGSNQDKWNKWWLENRLTYLGR